MSSTNIESNSINRKGPRNGECVPLHKFSTVEWPGPSRQQTTAQREWTIQENVRIMK